MSESNAKLPPYVKTVGDAALVAPFDSCFIPRGFLFPETREGLEGVREFPMMNPFYASAKREHESGAYDILGTNEDSTSGADIMDSTILHISEFDELLLDVQSTGMQYTLHTQNCLRDDLEITFPSTWDKTQSLLLNIPVFSEELCKWHYPISTNGFNTAMTDAPIDIDIAHNSPQLFGYLPNGDIAIYWEIADILLQKFQLDLEPLRTTVEGSLILMPLIPDDIKRQAPCDYVVETGIVVSKSPEKLDQAIAFATQVLGYRPVVLRQKLYQYYRINMPIVQCEQGINLYGEATWGAFGYTARRLAGFDFRVVNNPFMRQSPICSTENGNIIVSNEFFVALRDLLAYFGVGCCCKLFPIQRIP